MLIFFKIRNESAMWTFGIFYENLMSPWVIQIEIQIVSRDLHQRSTASQQRQYSEPPLLLEVLTSMTVCFADMKST